MSISSNFFKKSLQALSVRKLDIYNWASPVLAEIKAAPPLYRPPEIIFDTIPTGKPCAPGPVSPEPNPGPDFPGPSPPLPDSPQWPIPSPPGEPEAFPPHGPDQMPPKPPEPGPPNPIKPDIPPPATF